LWVGKLEGKHKHSRRCEIGRPKLHDRHDSLPAVRGDLETQAYERPGKALESSGDSGVESTNWSPQNLDPRGSSEESYGLARFKFKLFSAATRVVQVISKRNLQRPSLSSVFN
jgi:hypothetical protein